MATSSAITLPFRIILFVCDEAFQWTPYETSVLLHLENCSVFSLTVCLSLLQFQNNKGRNVFRRVWKNVM